MSAIHWPLTAEEFKKVIQYATMLEMKKKEMSSCGHNWILKLDFDKYLRLHDTITKREQAMGKLAAYVCTVDPKHSLQFVYTECTVTRDVDTGKTLDWKTAARYNPDITCRIRPKHEIIDVLNFNTLQELLDTLEEL